MRAGNWLLAVLDKTSRHIEELKCPIAKKSAKKPVNSRIWLIEVWTLLLMGVRLTIEIVCMASRRARKSGDKVASLKRACQLDSSWTAAGQV